MQGRRHPGAILRILGRGVLYRRGMALLIVVVSAAACAAAAVAPIYRSSAAVSALRARMTSAPANDSGVEVAGSSWPGDSPDQILAKEVPRLPLSTAVIRGITVSGTTTQLQVPNKPIEYAAIEWRQNQCAHVTFTSGRCPTGPHEIALPVSAAQVLKAQLGGPIVASGLDRPTFGDVTNILDQAVPPKPNLRASEYSLHEKVVGLFTVPPAQQAYWFGQDISAPVVSPDGTQVADVTALVPRATLVALPPPFRSNVVVDQLLDWTKATPAELPAVEHAIAGLQAHHRENISVLTQVPSLLRADAADRHQLNHLVTLAQLQLLLLVGLVLIAILAASMDRRRTEFIIATLNGRRPLSTAMSISAEPILLLLVGIIPGLLVSVPLAYFAAHLWLRSGTPVHLTASAVVAALVVTAVAAVVTVATALVVASRSLSDQLAEDARSAGGRGGAWIDIVAITLAAAGVIELFSSHSGNASTPWSLLAPSLTGLAAGLALGRLVPALLRGAVRSTAESRDLGRFLAVRELRRDRAAWRVTAMVALAMSLLAFAVTVGHGASQDRTDRAGLIVGAPTVADVLVPPSETLTTAVRRADAKGRWAMAAELLAPFGSAAQRTLALDTTRLAAVAGWHRRIDGLTPKGMKRILHVPGSVAQLSLPMLTAGDVGGSSFGLNNEPIRRMRVYQTSVLPELLGQGALTDLSSLIAVGKPIPIQRLGSTQLTDQVWIGSHAPADALARLRAAGLTITSVSTRSGTARTLERSAETAGLSGYVAVAVIAAILAVALLIGTSIAAAGRQRSEALALTSAGVPRATVVRGRSGAAATRLAIAGIVALVCGIATAHLAAHLIPQASAGAIPKPLLPLPVPPAVIAVFIALIPALIAEVVIASYVAKRTDVRTLRAAMT
ncbi:MAG TPA: FtsX-like permease family protein [Mycobacteriales bacterium]|nr:FtsX-like permease family protein [Mycobacteriales bacterium]